MLKKYFLSLAIVSIASLLGLKVEASEYVTVKRVIGLGVVLGEPTGLTAKWWIERDWAFDVGVSYSFFSHLHIMTNSLWHFDNAMSKIHPSLEDLSAYFGAGTGLRISAKDNPRSGDARGNLYIRVPMGIEYLPRRPRIGPFIEVAPGIALVPKVFAVIQGGLGIRYYF